MLCIFFLLLMLCIGFFAGWKFRSIKSECQLNNMEEFYEELVSIIRGNNG
jgi:hypothetical protein